MYKINDKKIRLYFDELKSAQEYMETFEYNSKLYDIECSINEYIKKGQIYYEFNIDNEIIKYVIEMYKSKVDMQMIQNAIMWSIINIDNLKKAELELLYKTIVANKLRGNNNENELILSSLNDNNDLLEYIVYTPTVMDIYENDSHEKKKVLEHLRKY